MLLANISVAQKIYDEFSECALLRKHPAPPPSNYDILLKAAKSKVSAERQPCFISVYLILLNSTPANKKNWSRSTISLIQIYVSRNEKYI